MNYQKIIVFVLFVFAIIYLYKKQFQDYEVIIHNHCMRKFIDIYYNWHNLILKLKGRKNNKETKPKIKTERNRFGYPFYK